MAGMLVDSDALIKITKAGLKESLTAHLDLRIVAAVRREVVQEGKKAGAADAVEVERNIVRGRLKVLDPVAASPRSGLFSCGEAEVVAEYEAAGNYEAVISDDERFIKRALECGIEVLTPASALVLLVHRRKISAGAACARLSDLRPFISRAEFVLAGRELRCKELK
jgi:hypothetical protein